MVIFTLMIQSIINNACVIAMYVVAKVCNLSEPLATAANIDRCLVICVPLLFHNCRQRQAVVVKANVTRKPCCRKETARYRSCSFRFSSPTKLTTSLRLAKLRKPGFRPENIPAQNNLMQYGHSRSFKVTCFGVGGKAIRR